MRFMLPIFGLILMLQASGCQTFAPSSQFLPDWVQNPPISDKVLYATGEGISLKEAQLNAQQSLSAQLLSHISSNLSAREVIDNEFHRTYIEKLTKAHFSNIALPNSQFTKQEKSGVYYYSQIRLDKATLKRYLQQSLTQNIQQVHQILNQVKRNNAFERWWLLQQSKPQITTLTDQTLIFNALFSPKNSRAESLLGEYSELMYTSKQPLLLVLDDNTPVTGLSSEIGKQLSAAQIQTQQSSFFGASPELELNLSNRNERLMGDYQSHATLTVLLKSARGNVLATAAIKARGLSLQSAKDAQRKSYRAILQQLKKQSILKQLKK